MGKNSSVKEKTLQTMARARLFRKTSDIYKLKGERKEKLTHGERAVPYQSIELPQKTFVVIVAVSVVNTASNVVMVLPSVTIVVVVPPSPIVL